MDKFINEPRIHDAALILGCGPSINLLTPEHLKTLQVDTFGINNFCVHEWLIPNYMQCEVKLEQKEKTDFFINILESKKDLLKKTGFLLPIEDTDKVGQCLPQELRRLEIPFNGYNPCRPHATYSFGRLLSVVNGKKYKTIYLLGCDMFSSEYFWAGRKDLPRFMDFSNAEIGYTADTPHRSASEGIISRIIPYVKKNKINVVNLSPISLWKDHLPTKALSDL